MPRRRLYIKTISKRLRGAHCPACGAMADGATSLDDREFVDLPQPGDYAMCKSCGAINTYTADLKLEPLTEKDRALIDRDPRLRALLTISREALMEFHKKRN